MRILTNPIIRRRVRKPPFKDSTVAKEAQMIPTAILSLILMGQVVLPGSNVGLEEAQEKAIHIVIAETSGIGIIFGVGAASFGSVDLKPSTDLKGKAKDRDWKKVSIVASGDEIIPNVGEVYIFFVDEYAGQLNIRKMLPKTEENLEAVRKEIKAKAKNP